MNNQRTYLPSKMLLFLQILTVSSVTRGRSTSTCLWRWIEHRWWWNCLSWPSTLADHHPVERSRYGHQHPSSRRSSTLDHPRPYPSCSISRSTRRSSPMSSYRQFPKEGCLRCSNSRPPPVVANPRSENFVRGPRYWY